MSDEEEIRQMIARLKLDLTPGDGLFLMLMHQDKQLTLTPLSELPSALNGMKIPWNVVEVFLLERSLPVVVAKNRIGVGE